MIEAIHNCVQKAKARYLDELFSLLRIPSVSADPAFSTHVHEAAKFLEERLHDLKMDQVAVYPTDGYPIVYGEKLIGPSLPTILVYGHYDVQPADPYDLWETEPFEPQIRDGKIYARGAGDDKGQFYMHLKAIETLQATTGLACNVKVMLEGEEEVGSDNLETFVEAHKEMLQADVVMISDTSMISSEHPSITVGLRGLSYLQVEVTGPNRDLHSGVYGGSVANPANILCKMIASLHDDQNRVTIPGFYDRVVELSEEGRAGLAEAPFDLKAFKEGLDIDEVHGEQGYSTIERQGIRPTLDVNGIWGGYTGQGAKTVLPAKAHAKISMRLVPNQQSEEIAQLFTDYFKSLAPKSVKVKVTPFHGGEPAVTPTDSPAFKAAEKAFEDAWGKKPIATRDGGSIPIVALFERALGINSLLMGFGLDEDAIHSPNESYRVFQFEKGIETIALFHHHFSKSKG